jgi:hypothetical protein
MNQTALAKGESWGPIARAFFRLLRCESGTARTAEKVVIIAMAVGAATASMRVIRNGVVVSRKTVNVRALSAVTGQGQGQTQPSGAGAGQPGGAAPRQPIPPNGSWASYPPPGHVYVPPPRAAAAPATPGPTPEERYSNDMRAGGGAW